MSAKANKTKKSVTLGMYDVLVSPVVTEKATIGMQNAQYTFRVSKDSSKRDIRSSIEALYKVKVESVNTININGKIKRFRGRIGKRNDIRKAIVRLAAGQTIDVGIA